MFNHGPLDFFPCPCTAVYELDKYNSSYPMCDPETWSTC